MHDGLAFDDLKNLLSVDLLRTAELSGSAAAFYDQDGVLNRQAGDCGAVGLDCVALGAITHEKAGAAFFQAASLNEGAVAVG